MMWGKSKENGIWRAMVADHRVMWCDALYIACGQWRLRLMKPW